ncbi:MAG TPA: toll/interleukin-1 receptor domain-containing protein [Candidatus Deferrimicrobium sp.]|nr:toll/interleukin-1 receptor domain-containing protein [Candidatus Deferrimicrobium sp.]
MAYKVFLSHSTRDQGLVMALANLLTKFKVDVFVAEWQISPGERIAKKVLNQIEHSDCVVALLTRHGIRSKWVQQEVRYALKSKKLLIPLVEQGLGKEALGALSRVEYVPYKPDRPEEALKKLATYVQKLQLKKHEKEEAQLVVGSLAAFFLLLYMGKK